jgi:hypothetical protein
MSRNTDICVLNLCTREIHSNVTAQVEVISVYTFHISLPHTYKKSSGEK